MKTTFRSYTWPIYVSIPLAVMAGCGSSGNQEGDALSDEIDEDVQPDVLEDPELEPDVDEVDVEDEEEPVNTPPSVDEVTISPDAPRVGDTLSCTYSGYADAEGDPDGSTMAWTVNGATAGTGDTLSTGFAAGDTVVCIVVPHDGKDSGTPVADTVVILDAAISGMVWLDDDRSGSFEVGESGAADRTVFLDTDEDGELDTGEMSAISQSDGTYEFPDLSAGTYVVTLLDAVGWDRTYPSTTHSVELTSGLVYEDVDFGVAVNDAPSIDSVTITPDPARLGSVLTCEYSGYSDPEGDPDSSRISWAIGGVFAGISPTLAGGFVAGDTVECTVVPSDGHSDGTPMSASTVIFDGAILGTVWLDANGDGVFDSGETGIAGRTLYIDADDSGTLDTGELTTTSGVDGLYEFADVPAGIHIVAQDRPGGWSQTYPSMTLDISDDFEDGVIDPSLWSTTGDGMSESGGMLRMERSDASDSITLLAALPDSFSFSLRIRPVQVQWRDMFHGFQVEGVCIPADDVKGTSFGFCQYGNHYHSNLRCSGASFDYHNGFSIGTWYDWSAVVAGGTISIDVDGTPRATGSVPAGPLTLWLPGYYDNGGSGTMTISEVEDFTLTAVVAQNHTVIVGPGEIVEDIDFGDDG